MKLSTKVLLAVSTLPSATPVFARDIARACIKGDAVAAPLLERRLREGTGIATCDRRAKPIVFKIGGSGPGFVLEDGRSDTRILASSTLGLVQGAGWLLRRTDVSSGHASIALPKRLVERPAVSIRMTQIGYRPKNNSLDGWTTAMFARRLEDMALWGASGVQVISPISDDAPSSPLFPQPPIETLRAIGENAHRLGMQFTLYYPMLGDYPDAAAIEHEVKKLKALLTQLPTIDGFYVPGGDPGHTKPDRLFPLVEQAARAVRRSSPRAGVWLSTQGFDEAGLEVFYRELAREPEWLTGIFAGPQTRDPVALQRRRVPSRYRLLLYPDIAHTMHAQFPIQEWYPEFALTEGREPINPQPAAQTAIARHFSKLHSGFITYSEGVADDFNQFLWYRIGWNPTGAASEAAADYARMFVGDVRAATLIHSLETNWVGDPAANEGIDATLSLSDSIRPGANADWRIDTLRYRAVYDAVVRHRTIAARARRAAAMTALNMAGSAATRVAAARRVLAEPDGARIEALQARLLGLATGLYNQARLQLSVERFGATHVERGANLDRSRVDLIDRLWLERAMDAALVEPDERERNAALERLGDVSRQAEGALYDDLGNPAAEPHLVRGAGFERDPQMFETAIDGIADRTPEDGWRMAQLSYGEALYDAPLRLRYDGLNSRRTYRVAVTYAGEDYSLPIRLVANQRFEIHGPRQRRHNPETVEFPIPVKATADGALELSWTRPAGVGGSGRGFQVAEVWLIPDQEERQR